MDLVHYVHALCGVALFALPGLAIVAWAAPRRRGVSSFCLGLSFPVGVAWVAGGMYLLSHLGAAAIRRGPLLLLGALPIAAALIRSSGGAFPLAVRGARLRPERGRLPRAARWAAHAVTAAVVGAVFADASTDLLTDWDGLMTWGAQARFLRGAGTVDAQVLRDEEAFVSNRTYPVLLPVAQAAVLEVLGVDDDRAIRPIYAAFLASFALMLHGFLHRRAGAIVASATVAFAVTTPHLSLWPLGGARGAYSDLPLACFLGAAAALLLRGPRRLRDGLLAGLLLGAAALTKIEGLPLAAFVLAVSASRFAVRLRRPPRRPSLEARRAARTLAAAALGLGAATAIYLSWRAPIPGDTYRAFGSIVTSPEARARAAGNLAQAFPEIFRETTTSRWALAWPVFGLALLVAAFSSHRPPVADLLLFGSGPIAGGLLAYATSWCPAELARATWGRFLVQAAFPVFALLGLALSAVLRSPRAALRNAAAAVFLGALSVQAFVALRSAGGLWVAAWRHRGESVAEARRRHRGPEYEASLAAVRRRLPPDAAYLLVKGSAGAGMQNLVRYDLAPRRPRFLGTILGARREVATMARSGDLPVVVIGEAGEPIRLVPAEEFRARFPEFFLASSLRTRSSPLPARAGPPP